MDNEGNSRLPKLRDKRGEFARELVLEWWGLLSCAAFTILSVVLAGRSSASFVTASAFLALFFLVLAFYRIWGRQYDANVGLASRIEHLEKAVYGGDPEVVPSTMVLRQGVSSQSSAPGRQLHSEFRVFKMPTTATAIHVEFTWPYSHVLVELTEAKWPDSLQAKANASVVNWEASGLYGLSVRLLAAPTTDSILKLYVTSSDPIQVRSVRAHF